MKKMTLLIIAVLVAIFSSGCVSQSAVDAAIDQKIAANNAAYVQPLITQQCLHIGAIRADVVCNQNAISKSNEQVSERYNVLMDHYKKQQQAASNALLKAAPVKEPVQIEPVEKETISASVSASEAVPQEVVLASSGQ
jgi:hypothetical protein